MKKIILTALLLCYSAIAFSHGYITSPSSRAYLCKLKINTDCGAVEYEPQSIEGPKGFPEKGPKDGKIASAGLPQFSPLDVQTKERWAPIAVSSGKIEFLWYLTAIHKTTKWEYFITKPNWNPNQPLARSQFELKPFCQFNKVETPPKIVKHNCNLPPNYSGDHVILGVWTIDNTAMAFYQVIDVKILK